jgi:hypothetical protein
MTNLGQGWARSVRARPEGRSTPYDYGRLRVRLRLHPGARVAPASPVSGGTRAPWSKSDSGSDEALRHLPRHLGTEYVF